MGSLPQILLRPVRTTVANYAAARLGFHRKYNIRVSLQLRLIMVPSRAPSELSSRGFCYVPPSHCSFRSCGEAPVPTLYVVSCVKRQRPSPYGLGYRCYSFGLFSFIFLFVSFRFGFSVYAVPNVDLFPLHMGNM